MSASPLVPKVPALPDDHQLSQHIPDWPIVPTIRQHLKELTGSKLFEMGDLGELTLQDLTSLYAKLKKCGVAFDDWYEDDSPGWHAEEAARPWVKWRISRHKDLDEVCERIREIQGEFTLAERQEGLRRQAAKKAEQDRIAEEGKQRRLAELEEQKALQHFASPEARAEIDAAIEQEKNTAPIPSAVSLAQASVDLPKAPKTISATAVYGRTVTDWSALLLWLAHNPTMVGVLKVTLNFTPLKYKDAPIPGVKVEQLPDKVANRGK